MKSIFEQVVERSLPLIENFEKDLLVHDRCTLEMHPNVPFIHFTGKSGTNLEMLQPPDAFPEKGKEIPYLFGKADRYHLLQSKVDAIEHMPKVNRQELILYYDGATDIYEISQSIADAIARNYAVGVRKAWYYQEKETA